MRVLNLGAGNRIVKGATNHDRYRHREEIDIAHDLNVVRHVSSEVAVMYLGIIVERAPRDIIYRSPLHPYTKALLAAVPIPDPKRRGLSPLGGDVPEIMAIPPGCRFHPRCPIAEAICKKETPKLIEKAPGHFTACHMMKGK